MKDIKKFCFCKRKKSSKNCISKKHCIPEQNTSFSFEFDNLRVQEKQEKEFLEIFALHITVKKKMFLFYLPTGIAK
jgi:hypothetical protein